MTTDIAALGIKADSSGVKTATDDLNDLAVAAGNTEKATSSMSERMVASVNRMLKTLQQIDSSLAAVAASQGRASQEVARLSTSYGQADLALQKFVDRQTGAAGSARQWTGPLANMAQELDKLRSKYDPLFDLQQRYNGAIDEINHAQRVGALTTEQSIKAKEREKAVYDRLAASIDHVYQAQSKNANPSQVGNIAAQIQDIGVTSAMGMSPFMIALQQGAQLSAVISEMQSPARGLAAAFASVISPVSLITIGIVAAGAALVQWGMTAFKTGKTLDETMDGHAKSLEHIKVLYGDVSAAMDRLASSGGEAFSRSIVSQDMIDLRKQLDAQLKDIRVSLRGDAGLVNSSLSFLGLGSDGGDKNVKSLMKLSNGAEVYQGVVDDFLSSIRAGKADLEAFDAGLNQAYQSQVQLGGDANQLMLTVDTLRVMARSALEVKSEFAKFGPQINQATIAIADGTFDMKDFIERIGEIGSANGITEQANKIIKLFEPIVKVTDGINELKAAAEAIPEGQFGPDISLFRDEIQRIEELKKAEEERLSARLAGLSAITDAEKIAAAAAAAGAGVTDSVERGIREDIAAREERARLAIEENRAIEDRMRQRQDDITQQNEELSLIGKSVGEVARLQYQYQQLASVREEAARNGREASSSELEEIRRTAEEIGNLTREMELANIQRDLLFEREQMTRSPVEQKVAGEMRKLWGDDYGTHMDSATAGQIRFNERLRETQEEMKAINDLGKETFMSIIDALTESGDRAENLIKAFANIGKQFAKMGAEQIWKNLQAGAPVFDFSKGTQGQATGSLSSIATGREIGATIAPAISERLNSSLTTYAAAVRKIESGSYEGNYQAMGPITRNGDRAYGAYQVMGNNIEKWTKEALGQSLTTKEFLASRAAQDKVFFTKFGQSVDKFGSMADATSVWFSGRPLSKAGNASDGYNTVPQYVTKVQNAANAYGGSELKMGVSAGMIDASRKLEQQDAHVQAYRNAQSANGSNAGGGNLGAMLGVGGAAFGAFSGGYQSGDPLMGGLSGAMAGFGAAPALSSLGLGAAAGPVGLIGGAIFGIVGGILGKSKQKKQQLQQAKDELESQIGAITELMRNATGDFMGAFEKQYSSTTDEFTKAMKLADKGRDFKLIDDLANAINEFFVELNEKWERGFEGMIQSLESGLGFDGAFIEGMDAVEKMRESLVGFVNDAKMFDEANGDLSTRFNAKRTPAEPPILNQYQEVWRGDRFSGLDISEKNVVPEGYKNVADQLFDMNIQVWNEKGGALYENLAALIKVANEAGYEVDQLGTVTKKAVDPQKEYSDSVERARKAAITAALAMLTGAEEFTAIEQEVQKLQGTAANLPSLLKDLGVSAEDAAKSIEDSLLTAMNKLRDDYNEELDRSITSLSGRGYLNEIADAQEVYAQRLKDTAALGISGASALAELNLSVADIASSASLTDDQLRQLAAGMPQFAELFLRIIDINAADKAVTDAEAAKDKAESTLRAAYDAQVSTLETLISTMKRTKDSIKAFKESLKLDSQLSPLSPFDKMMEAQRQYEEVAAKAANGDEEALGKIEDVSRAYLSEARAYYGSSTGYFKIWDEVNATLDMALSAAEKQITDAEKQLTTLKEQVSVLIEIDAGVKTVAEGIFGLNTAISALAAAQSARDALGTPSGAPSNAFAPIITELYREILNRAPDAPGAAFWTSQMNRSDMTLAKLREMFIQSSQKELMGGIPAFAMGGFHSGGFRLVGENGPELEATGASRIYNAAETSRILSRAGSYGSSNDNEEIIAELRQLREEVAVVASATVASGQAVVGAVSGTTGAVRGLQQTQAREKLNRG